jgi:hypothetical protein
MKIDLHGLPQDVHHVLWFESGVPGCQIIGFDQGPWGQLFQSMVLDSVDIFLNVAKYTIYTVALDDLFITGAILLHSKSV